MNFTININERRVFLFGSGLTCNEICAVGRSLAPGSSTKASRPKK